MTFPKESLVLQMEDEEVRTLGRMEEAEERCAEARLMQWVELEAARETEVARRVLEFEEELRKIRNVRRTSGMILRNGAPGGTSGMGRWNFRSMSDRAASCCDRHAIGETGVRHSGWLSTSWTWWGEREATHQ